MDGGTPARETKWTAGHHTARGGRQKFRRHNNKETEEGEREESSEGTETHHVSGSFMCCACIYLSRHFVIFYL